MLSHTNGYQKRAGVAILIADKINTLQVKNGNKRQWRSLYNDKGSIH